MITYSIITLVALWFIIGLVATTIGRFTYIGPVNKKGTPLYEIMYNVLCLSSYGPLLFDEVVSNYKFYKELNK